MKKIALLGILTTLITSCATSPMPLNSSFAPQPQRINAQSFGDAPFQRVQKPDEDLSSRILRNIYKENFADDIDNGRRAENISMPRGGFIYGSLNRLSLVRKGLYLISDKIIKREFNKPGKKDATPRINPSQVQEMLKVLKPGDIVLCGNNDSFVHALVYLGNDQIIHSLAQLTSDGKFVGTIKETLSGYAKRVARDKFVVLRKPNLTPQDFNKMSAYAHSAIGTSYDSLFLLSTKDRLYCTEMVYHTLQQIRQGKPRVMAHKAKYGWDLFTVEDLMDSPDLQTVYEFQRKRNTPAKLHRY